MNLRYQLKYVYFKGVIAQADKIYDLFSEVVEAVRLGRSVLVYDRLRKKTIKEEEVLKVLGIKYD